MNAITLHQPYATLIARGIKEFETRSWPTRQLGPIAIHAGRKKMDADALALLEQLVDQFGFTEQQLPPADRPGAYPLGGVVATARLERCQLMTSKVLSETTRLEEEVGWWETGRYAWQLGNVRQLFQPVPMRGQQGVFKLTPEQVKAVLAELTAERGTG